MNIIAVDDEKQSLLALRNALAEALPNETAKCFYESKEALDYAKHSKVDVAFLDIEMDNINGLSLANELKKLNPDTNIIFVTGHSSYMEYAFIQHVSGYIKKPVQVERIRSEIKNLRNPVNENPELIETKVLGPYMFDHVTKRVYFDGRDAILKPKEFQLFHLFASNVGEVFTPEEIFKRIWGDDPYGNIHTVTVHISNLRKKLDMDKKEMPSIKKMRGQGYYLSF